MKQLCVLHVTNKIRMLLVKDARGMPHIFFATRRGKKDPASCVCYFHLVLRATWTVIHLLEPGGNLCTLHVCSFGCKSFFSHYILAFHPQKTEERIFGGAYRLTGGGPRGRRMTGVEVSGGEYETLQSG